MRPVTASICWFAVVLTAGAACAATIGIGETIGVDMEPTGGQTEPGFASLTPQTPSVTVKGTTLTLSASGALTARDRGALGHSPSDILRDFIFDSAYQQLTLSMTGMPAGLYEVESWHYDQNFGERPDVTFDMVFIQNATETVVASGHWTTDVLSYEVTTDGTDFNLEYRNTWGASSDTRINAITFTLVPEPSTSLLALSALACGLLLRRRRPNQ